MNYSWNRHEVDKIVEEAWPKLKRKEIKMGMFDSMVRGYGNQCETASDSLAVPMKPRSFKETIGDQIAFHERKIAELKAVYDSLTPEIEKFVEAMQKLG